MNPVWRRSMFLSISVFAAADSLAKAAHTWTLTTGDLQRAMVAWSAMDAEGVTLADTANRPAVVPWADLVSLQRPAAPVSLDGQMSLALSDGARLVGSPVALGETSMQWREPKLGPLTVPIRQIRSVDRGVVSEPEAAAAQTDRVQFTNGDSLAGVILDVSADAVSIKTDAGVSSLPMATIRRVTFADLGGPVRPTTRPAEVRLRLSLDDGSIIDATGVASSNGALSLMPAGGKAAVSLPVSAIVSIDQPAGPVAWLSSRTPVSQSSDPFFPFGSGWPIKFGESTSENSPHRIAVHGRSSIRFDLDPGWARLHTRYQLQPADPDGPAWADATVRIRLDDKIAFERTHVRADAPAGVVDLPIGGATSLTLETDFGDVAGAQSAVDWLEPALMRESAATTQPAATADRTTR